MKNSMKNLKHAINASKLFLKPTDSHGRLGQLRTYYIEWRGITTVLGSNILRNISVQMYLPSRSRLSN